MLVDCDPQASCATWIADATPEVQIVRLIDSDAILNRLPELASSDEVVVVDCPGNHGEVGRAALLWSDLAIIPCKASAFEAQALEQNLSYARQARAIRRGKPATVVVLTMVGKRYRLTREMLSAVEEIGNPVARTMIGQRQALADAPGQGTFAWSMGSQAAAAACEIDALYDELITPLLNGLKGNREVHQKKRKDGGKDGK